MHAANRPPRMRECLIDLSNGVVPARGGEFCRTEEARKVAPMINDSLPFNHFEVDDRRVVNDEPAYDTHLNRSTAS